MTKLPPISLSGRVTVERSPLASAAALRWAVRAFLSAAATTRSSGDSGMDLTDNTLAGVVPKTSRMC